MQNFDYIVVGAGSAGCVLANRLSEDPSNRVCLLEAGGEGNTVMTSTPGAFGYFMFSREYNWRFEGKPQADIIEGKGMFTPRGKMLGGSSAINGMVYIRGDKSDYDHWAELGNQGWSYDEVLPYFRLSETNENGANKYHGDQGPLYVSNCTPWYDASRAFIEAGQQAGHPFNGDFNGEQLEGVGTFQFTIKDGQRCGTKRAYLEPVMDRPNLTILTAARATKVVLEGKKAVGVELLHKGQPRTIKASKEVLLSGGAFASPQLLMLSGVGVKEELEAHGIAVHHELPGVGKNLQEHPDAAVLVQNKKREGVSLAATKALDNIRDLSSYVKDRSGPLANSVTDVGGFLKTHPEVEVPDLQVHFLPLLFDDHGRNVGALMKYGYSCHVCVVRPKSRGSVSLASSDPTAAPVIDYQFLTHPDDCKVMVDGIRRIREIFAAEAMDLYRGEEIFPGVEAQSDEEILAQVKKKLGHVYHPVGTCKMGHDDLAVVDDQLRVHGMENLRVIDASVMPTLVSGNTNAPTIMIAEKVSDIIMGRNRAGQVTKAETETV